MRNRCENKTFKNVNKKLSTLVIKMGKVKKEAARKQYPCLDCGTVLSSSYNLKIHNETKCSTEKNFICEVETQFSVLIFLKFPRNSLGFRKILIIHLLTIAQNSIEGL